MPIGKNNTDLNTTGTSYKDGTSVTIPHEFSTPVTLPKDFGISIPVSDPTFNSNPVTWQPSPDHFGNVFNPVPPSASGFELEDNSGVILLEDGDTLLLEVQ